MLSKENTMKRMNVLMIGGLSLALVASAAIADAATIRVRCEQRANRSKISVDGNNLAAGNYRAQVISGANQKTAAAQAALGDEVEFDFDSDSGDIAEGATPIPAGFIQGRTVTGKILNASGFVVVSDTVACRAR
jgi:hypothetical protein